MNHAQRPKDELKMNIFEIASKRPLCFHDAEAQEFVGHVEESYKKHGGFFGALYLCIAYGEIRGIRQERARRKGGVSLTTMRKYYMDGYRDGQTAQAWHERS